MAKLELYQRHRDEVVGPQPIDPGSAPLPNLERISQETPERLTERDREVLAWSRDLKKRRAQYLKAYRSYVNRSNAHLAAIQAALSAGLPVPAHQFESYPFLNGWCANNGVTIDATYAELRLAVADLSTILNEVKKL